MLSGSLTPGHWWIYGDFVLFPAVFLAALCINFNFNTVIVGLIYLLPLVSVGLSPENADASP